jgi:ribosome-associated protein
MVDPGGLGVITSIISSMTSSPQQAESAPDFDSEAIARRALEVGSDRLGSDIALLDISDVSDFTDFFVVMSGETARHLEALASDIARGLREEKIRVIHREGTGQGGWILLDYGGVVVHIFDRDTRERYALERLWARGREVVRIQ